jgi:DNA-binding CsgD family transcriptional regulator
LRPLTAIEERDTTLQSLHFVGRGEELATLHGALEAAEAGRPSVVVMHGEEGVGKTRTASEFADQARDRGALVLWGSCYEHGGVLPYCPFGEAIDGYVESLERPALSRLGTDAPILAALTPRIEASRDRAGLPANGAGVQELSAALGRLLNSLESPAVLVLDDLQWAPPASLDMFSNIAGSAATVMILAMYAGRELDIGYPLARCLGEVNRRRSCQYVRLSGLTLADSTELLEDVARSPVSPQVAEAMFRASRGNPFFLSELGRNLAGPGGMPGDGEWRPPEAIRQAVALRLAGLSVPTRDLLERASVLSRGFTFEELGLLTDLDEGGLLLLLEEALAADVIRPAGGERYEFGHAVLRYTLYAHLSPSRRVRLHRRLAEGLERTHEGRTSDVAAELARQYHGSATLPGAERGIAYALAAVEQARTAHLPVEAVELARIAIDLTGPDDASNQGAVMGQLALAQAEAGMLEDAVLSLEGALSQLDETGASPEAVAVHAYQVLSKLRILLPHQDVFEPVLARALVPLGATRSLAWARLKLLERPYQPLAAGPVHASRWQGFNREAVQIAREEGSDDDYFRTIDWYLPQSMGDLEDWVVRFDSSRDAGLRLTGLTAATHHLFLRQGVTPAVERWCTECETLAAELDTPGGKAAIAIQRAMMLGEQGRFKSAAASIAEARAIGAGIGTASQIDVGATLVGELTAQHVAPDWQHAATLTRQLAATAEPFFWSVACAAFASHAFAQAGMATDSHALLIQITPVLVAGQLAPYAQSIALSLAASAAWQLRDAALAEEILGCALARSGEGDWYMASNELSMARLAMVLGRSEMAVENFARARESLDERGQRPLRAIVDYDEAIARRSSRQPGAARLFASASAQFAELGMAEWSRRVAAEDVTAELPDDLTPREAEILRLLATGTTNNEIAAALFLSVHTVERHLTNSYRKVGARNRADATAYVMRTGL